MKRLFNIDHVEIRALSGNLASVRLCSAGGGDVSFSGVWYRQIVSPGEGTTVLGRFEDGEPALIEYAYGKGRAIWIGTYPAACFEMSADRPSGGFLSGLADKSGYEVIRSLSVSCNSGGVFPLAPVIRLLETDVSYALVLVNHSESEARVSLDFNFPAEFGEITLPGLAGKIIEVAKPAG
jgi:hypothetical protein